MYDPGRIELFSVEGDSALVLALSATDEGGTSEGLDTSTFLVLATRDGLRCIFLSRIWFCCTSRRQKTSSAENRTSRLNRGLDKLCAGLASSTAYASKLNLEIFDSLFGARKGGGQSWVVFFLHVLCKNDHTYAESPRPLRHLPRRSSSPTPPHSAFPLAC